MEISGLLRMGLIRPPSWGEWQEMDGKLVGALLLVRTAESEAEAARAAMNRGGR